MWLVAGAMRSLFFHRDLPSVLQVIANSLFSHPVLQREPDREEQAEDNMPPKFKRHLNDDEVTGSIRSERVRHRGVFLFGGGFGLFPSSRSRGWRMMGKYLIF